ncbi:MAG: hypothetical protein ACJAZS_000219 [Alteromonas naphthalenivorans]|jgi:hypothetical protein
MIIMKLRKGLQGKFGKGILIGLFIALTGGIGISSLLMRFLGNGMDGIAKINGYDVSQGKFQRATIDADRQIAMIRQQYGQSADILLQLNGMSSNPQEAALKNVVKEALIDEAADKMGLYLAPEYLDARLGDPQFIFNKIGHQLPHYVFDQKYGINAEALMQVLKTPQMRGVEDKLINDLRRDFTLMMIKTCFYMPQFMIQASYKEAHTSKKFSIQTFTLSSVLQKEKAKGVSEAQLNVFYEKENKKNQRYLIPEKRSGVTWTFAPDTYGIKITEKEIEKYYTDHKRNKYVEAPAQFKVREIVFNKLKDQGVSALKDLAESVHKRVVEAPKKFAEIAKEVSQTTTASKGGLVEFFKRGTKDKSYEKAVVRLKTDGDVSAVTQMADGSFVILQRVARKEASYKSLAHVKDAIIKSLKDQKFRTRFSKEADRAVKSNDKELLASFIKEHNGKKESVAAVERADQGFGRRLFILKKDGQSMSFVQDGKGMILQLDKKIAKKLPKLESLKDTVKEDYFEQKATSLLEDQMKKARAQGLSSGKLVKVDGSTISSTGFLQATDTQKIKDLIDKQGYPHGFMNLDWEGAVMSSLNKDGAIVLKLDETEKINDTLYKAQKQKLHKEAFKRFGQGFDASYIASLYRNATIKVNDELAQLKDVLL